MEADKKKKRYQRIKAQLINLFAGCADPRARMASIAALLYHKLEDYFWCGFYILAGDELLVGPYQGPLACMSLPRGRGVCWAAVQRGEPMVVDDVHAFPEHIACDPRSRSEIVVPVRNGPGKIVAVLDVDSKKPAAFDQLDRACLEEIIALIYKDSAEN